MTTEAMLVGALCGVESPTAILSEILMGIKEKIPTLLHGDEERAARRRLSFHVI
jgi:hypothetical protein